MTLALTMNNGLSGLRSNQRSISVLSHNIANVSTPGYSRQTVDQSAVYVEGVGNGVRVEDVIRKVDKYLQRTVQENGSIMNRASILNDFATRLQVLIGEPGASNTLDEYLTTFSNTLQALAETPERTSLRSSVVSAGSLLASEVARLATGIEDLRYQADQEMQDAVTAMNILLKKIDGINAAIGRSVALGQSAAGLLDERDIALTSLSEYVDVDIFYAADGQANVYSSNGAPLIDGSRHEISYRPLSSVDSIVGDNSFNALSVLTLASNGDQIGSPLNLISSGTSDEVTTRITGGKLAGLQQARDVVMPEVLAELDMLASRLRDEMNRVHNLGTSYPPPTSLTGTRLVKSSQLSDWSGAVRIAALTPAGDPVTAGYSDETATGFRPLTLDLSTLDSGDGQGKPTMQTIIDEINNHFGAPQIKTKIGVLNNIQLTSNTPQLPSGSAYLFNFDFDAENISGDDARTYVTNVTVRDDTATDITNVTNTIPTVDLNTTNTIEAYTGQDYFTVTTASTPTVKVGDWVYLPDPGTMPLTIGGIANTNFVGYFQVSAISGNELTLDFPPLVFTNINEVVGIAGATMSPPYDTIQGGEKRRTTDSGTFTADLSGAPGSEYYDISIDVGVIDDDGNLSTSTITYRVDNERFNLRNKRYAAASATDDAVRVLPYSSQEVLRAIMVNADGQEIQKINGKYIDEPGYLKLVSNNANYRIAIDSLDSKQLGDRTPAADDDGTGRGFSHYFGLNNFFADNVLTLDGDTVAHSAVNMAVTERMQDDPNLLANGKISLSRQPVNPADLPLYTYVRNSGDNSLAQTLASVMANDVSFGEAGKLAASSMSVTSYLSEILGLVASQAASTEAEFSSAETLYNGFKSKLEGVTGVNLDEELANTIIYQNAYTASARIVKVVDELYQDILDLV